MMNTLQKIVPTFYIPHGGGPCFDMTWPDPMAEGFNHLGAWLRQFNELVGVKPKAVLVISAHWETSVFTVSTNPKPSMLYDYTGFPPHTYELKYDASGSPALGQQIYELISEAGIPVKTDVERGFDHGVFVPFRLIYPDADVPIIQLSIQRDLDPKAHLELGRALIPLREQGVLIIGSGMSFHNFGTFMKPAGAQDSAEFDQALTTIVEDESNARNAKLSEWDLMPAGRKAHPQEDHLIPLMVVAGAAGSDLGKCVYNGTIMGVIISGYQFGNTIS